MKSLEENHDGLFGGKCCAGSKFQRNPALARSFGAWLSVFTILNIFLVYYPYLKEPKEDAADAAWGTQQTISVFAFGFNVMSLILFTYSSCKSPGYLLRMSAKDKPTWNELVEVVNFSMLCPECEIIKHPRSRHCYLCGSCINRFDHHCEWLNQCVGGNNNVGFFFFLLTFLGNIFVTLYLVIFLIYAATVCHFKGEICREYQEDETPTNGLVTYMALAFLGI